MPPPGMGLNLKTSVAVSWLSALLFVLCCAHTAQAVEIHTLVDAKCQSISGVVVAVDDEQVRLLGLDGTSHAWRRDDIASVVLHKAVDNPIPAVTLDTALRSVLYDVYLSSSDPPAFTGWAVQFIEELVVFFDLQGRTHVLSFEDIHSMRQPDVPAMAVMPHAPITLHFPADYVECQNLANSSGVPPSRIIGDRVKVSDYFDTFAAHYLALDSFRERTFLYAKPFLFDERTRLGLLYMRHRTPLLPAYIHWSTGRPYAFQSFMLIGGAPVLWLPSVDPAVVVWSDLKSHVFHATFLANPFAIPAGSTIYGGGVIEPRTRRDRHTESSFNYLILMGADYGPWSASVGTYYPARFIRMAPLERDVRATRASLTFRARATFEQLAFRALYFRTRQSAANGRGLGDGNGETYETEGTSYALAEDTLRLGATVDAFEMRGALDAVVTLGTYEEVPAFDLAFQHLQLGLTLSREFGHYVRMNVHTNYHVEHNEFTSTAATNSSDTRAEFDYGGAFEFQF
jgi:hypothetical protein